MNLKEISTVILVIGVMATLIMTLFKVVFNISILAMIGAVLLTNIIFVLAMLRNSKNK